MKDTIISFFDRNYNLLFNSKNCIHLTFYSHSFKYNEMIDGFSKVPARHLGNGWFVISKSGTK